MKRFSCFLLAILMLLSLVPVAMADSKRQAEDQLEQGHGRG